MDVVHVQGERLLVPERVIVAPVAGVFRPLPPEQLTAEGDVVHEGQPVGVLEGLGTRTEVLSPFRGHLMGMLVHQGERVREGEPVAWLRTA